MALILLFILADVMCDNSIFQSFGNEVPTLQLILFAGLLLLQIIAAPIQSGFSDYYCRKKSLMISLSFSLAAMVMQYFYVSNIMYYFSGLILMGLLKGGLGNTIPMAWAAVADTQEKNIRFSFALSTGAFAIAYLLLITGNKFLSDAQSSLIIIGVFMISIILCGLFFWDVRDRSSQQNLERKNLETGGRVFREWKLIANDLKLVFKDLSVPHNRNALLAFLLFEISLYSILLLYVDFNVKEFSSISLAMVIGYLFGVFVLKFCRKIHDNIIIRIGYNISAFSLVPFFVSYPFTSIPSFTLLSICYFFHMTGNAFLSATLFSVLASEREPHEQGRIYGLIASADTIAFLLSSLSVIVYNSFNLSLIYIISFSFLTVGLSWYPYAKFEKSRPKIRG
ncbi:MAG: MFS transporter [Parachlamydiales bacterium]|nr:MFS transporter [Parachlamydiales bacterium]